MLRNWLIISVEKFGIKETLPPYLDPTLEIEDLLTGVSFASAGSGYDHLTTEVAVIITLLSHHNLFSNSQHFSSVFPITA